MPEENSGLAGRVYSPGVVAERSVDLQDFRALHVHQRLTRLDEVEASWDVLARESDTNLATRLGTVYRRDD